MARVRDQSKAGVRDDPGARAGGQHEVGLSVRLGS